MDGRGNLRGAAEEGQDLMRKLRRRDGRNQGRQKKVALTTFSCQPPGVHARHPDATGARKLSLVAYRIIFTEVNSERRPFDVCFQENKTLFRDCNCWSLDGQIRTSAMLSLSESVNGLAKF